MGAGYRLPLPAWDGELRKCVKCGLIDNPIYAGEADPETGSPIFLHRVVLDVVFCKTEVLTGRDKAEGFLMMKLDGGRPAKVRAICRECLEQDEQTSKVWKDFDKSRQELQDQSKDLSWYAQLCQ